MLAATVTEGQGWAMIVLLAVIAGLTALDHLR